MDLDSQHSRQHELCVCPDSPWPQDLWCDVVEGPGECFSMQWICITSKERKAQEPPNIIKGLLTNLFILPCGDRHYPYSPGQETNLLTDWKVIFITLGYL